MKYFIGIDIGSTCAKTVVLGEAGQLLHTAARPTGWSSVDTAEDIAAHLTQAGYAPSDGVTVATGYGRVSVPYARKTVTEITCHARGAAELFAAQELTVLDIGGQDTKIIRVQGGVVEDFLMNDRCSAGTGRFLEVMAATLGLRPEELCALALRGGGVHISSMCTVFAESEVTGLIGSGERRENIAFAVLDSIAEKVAAQARKLYTPEEPVCLTGGLSGCPELVQALQEKLGCPVRTHELGRFAGAVGAALLARK